MFDVNVYLDIADLFGCAPADLASSVAQALRRFADIDTYPHPCHPLDLRNVDSLRAVALACGLGDGTGPAATAAQDGPAWSIAISNHIAATVMYKLKHGENYGAENGWDDDEAKLFVKNVLAR